MEPADQIPRSRSRPPQNQNQPPTLSDNNFMLSDYIQACDVDGEFFKQRIIKISNEVDLISNGLELVGQQFVRMRDIRWRKNRHNPFVGESLPIYRDMNLVTLCIVKKRLCFFAAGTKHEGIVCLKEVWYGTSTWEYLECSFVSASAKHWALLSQLCDLQRWPLTMTISVDLLEWCITRLHEYFVWALIHKKSLMT